MPTQPGATPAPTNPAATPAAPANAAPATAPPAPPKVNDQQDPPRPNLLKYKYKPSKAPRSADYRPLKVAFLTGPYKGQSLDLGMTVNEMSHEQTAEWQDQQGQAIRVGSNFVNISPRTFTATICFWSLDQDVSHFAENVATLMEIGDGEAIPPKLHVQQGDIRAIPCVCTSFRPKYENPLPGSGGFRQCTIDLSFKLLGGADSPHRLAKPLTATYLTELRRSVDPLTWARVGQAEANLEVLAHCLKDPDSQKRLRDLLVSNEQDAAQWLSIKDDNTLIQAAVAGLVPPKVLQDPVAKDRLALALANTMAAKARGITKQQQPEFSQALRGLTFIAGGRVQTLAAQRKTDYEKILAALLTQELGEQSAIYQGTTGEEIINVGSCGLEMRKAGATQINLNSDKQYDKFWKKELKDKANLPGEKDRYILNKINEFLRSSPTDEDIVKRFGLRSLDQAKSLRNGAQFQSKDQFIRYMSTGATGISGFTIWENFFKNRVDEVLGSGASETPDE